jgi:hypothetical protein
MVDVLEDYGTSLNHSILSSLYVKEGVDVFINVPGTKPAKNALLDLFKI